MAATARSAGERLGTRAEEHRGQPGLGAKGFCRPKPGQQGREGRNRDLPDPQNWAGFVWLPSQGQSLTPGKLSLEKAQNQAGKEQGGDE